MTDEILGKPVEIKPLDSIPDSLRTMMGKHGAKPIGEGGFIRADALFNYNFIEDLNHKTRERIGANGTDPFEFKVTVPQDIEDRDKIIADLHEAELVTMFGRECSVRVKSVVADVVLLEAVPIEQKD